MLLRPHTCYWRLTVRLSYLLFPLLLTLALANKNQINSIYTCEGKCGQTIAFPCSCDARCYIHGNCCEMTHVFCPFLYHEAISKYGYLIHSEVTCSENNIFFISSCPDRERTSFADRLYGGLFVALVEEDEKPLESYDSTSDVSKSDWTTKVSTVNHFRLQMTSTAHAFYLKTNKPRLNNAIDVFGQTTVPLKSYPTPKGQHISIEEAIFNAPVLDKASGIVYKNSQIFSCHKRNYSDPVRWRVKIDVRGKSIKMSHESLEEALELEKITYLPPSDMENSMFGASCIANSQNQCMIGDALQTLLCNSFISYVHLPGHLSIFNNRFCAQCIFSNKKVIPLFRYESQLTSLLFSIVMSLSQNNKLDIETAVGGQEDNMTWSKGGCVLRALVESSSQQIEVGQTSQDNETPTCTIISCQPGFNLRPDGNCRTIHKLTLGVVADEHKILGEDVDKLSQFFGYCLEKHLGVEVENASQPTDVYFDELLKAVIYVTTLNVHLPFASQDITKFYEDDYGLIKVADMVKVLRSYNETVTLSVPTAATKMLDGFTNSSWLMKENNSKFLFEGRGKPITEQKVTVCSATSPRHKESSRIMQCWKDLYYESDIPYILRYSDCLSVFSGTEAAQELPAELNSAGTFATYFKALALQIVLVIMVAVM